MWMLTRRVMDGRFWVLISASSREVLGIYLGFVGEVMDCCGGRDEKALTYM